MLTFDECLRLYNGARGSGATWTLGPKGSRAGRRVINVQYLTSNHLDPVARVTICTIQRLYAMLRGEELNEDEKSGFELAAADQRQRDVQYNRTVPIETFDFIIADECHRSIYKLWRQVLEYFDAFLIGHTATPGKQAIGFFNKNLVGHRRTPFRNQIAYKQKAA